MVNEQPEYTELEDDELDEQTNLVVVIDNYFNFDLLVSATPNITRVSPPDFNNLVIAPVNPKFDRQYIDRTYYKKDNPAESVLLPHRWQYYYCGCIKYNNSLPTIEYPFNPCSVTPIPNGSQVYVITTAFTKRLSHTTSQRWYKDCWDKLRPVLEQSWLLYRQNLDQSNADKFFALHSVIDEHGNQIPEPIKKRGRPVSSTLFALSPEEAKERARLVQRRGNYMTRYRKAEQEGKDTDSIAVLLDKLYEQVSNLGGTPDGWVRYSNSGTAE